MLGTDCFTVFRCNSTRYTSPILMYDHDSGCAIIGGYRYRGDRIESLRGTYLYGDFCFGTLLGGREGADGRWSEHHLLSTDLRISRVAKTKPARYTWPTTARITVRFTALKSACHKPMTRQRNDSRLY